MSSRESNFLKLITYFLRKFCSRVALAIGGKAYDNIYLSVQLSEILSHGRPSK